MSTIVRKLVVFDPICSIKIIKTMMVLLLQLFLQFLFLSVYIINDSIISDLDWIKNTNDLNHFWISILEVFGVIMLWSWNPNFLMVLMVFNQLFWKTVSVHETKPLYKLVSISLNNAVFPSYWKLLHNTNFEIWW